ncbi:uncharacterized protein N7484_004022 [Penicillium longicatenatum]|uniref:uncharacterized protein n=1 Tax=Penicillium longicatenatum TaxID=1561947 RepID=UPI0025476DFB|nr:uncharacterized protein N7484_004022 [Penicillium longicatenatum]KAJ5650299.1 hypothetical protein N7484_004022 [Penicillium longicatenatum]
MEDKATILTNAPVSMAQADPVRPKKKRIRNWTAEDRAIHREFEKSRREAFGVRLMELTKLLPLLREETRPSKHIIVDASISHHKTQQARCDQATSAIKALIAERDDLLKEVNSLRSLCQPGTSVPRQARPIDPAVLDLLRESDEPDPDQIWPSAVNSSIEAQSDQTSSSSFPLAPFLPVSGEGPPQVPAHHDPTILLSSPTAYNSTEWAWPNSHTAPAAVTLGSFQDPAFIWNQSSGVSATTRPKDVDPRHNNGPSYLVRDSASFWTQHPGVLTTTPPEDPPQDGDFQYDNNPSVLPVDESLLWPPNIGITPMPATENRHAISSGQTF